jgi:hypothetical protein
MLDLDEGRSHSGRGQGLVRCGLVAVEMPASFAARRRECEGLVHTLLILAGLGQLVLVAGSLFIPRVLRWREETAKLRLLTRQVFWTYAGYIWATNAAFGLLSALAPDWLLDDAPIAQAVRVYMALYWTARVVIQFVYFDRADTPQGRVFMLTEVALVGLFIYLALVYSAIALGVR